VRGRKVNPVFAALDKAQGAPKWNFYKYLVDRDGNVVTSFGSRTAPDDEKFIAAIEQLVSEKP
jgi:glutathione peroxidase